jgi:hypothetical protein
MTTEAKSLKYLERYKDEDEGIRFRPGVTLTKPDMPPIPDGIAGDKIIRQHLKTRLLKEPLSLEDIRRPHLTLDELNDAISYFSWNLWDNLMLRASEGSQGLVPRQEYEALSFANAFYRWPEFIRDMVERLGGYEAIADLARDAAKEPGSKINLLHMWCLTAPVLNGRAVLLMLDHIKPVDYLVEINDDLKFYQSLAWGYRGDGYWFASQNRYTNRALSDDWIQRFQERAQPLEGRRFEQFTALMAATELLSFYLHFDCRLGMDDRGPWILDNGNPLIVRNCFVREDAYSWSMFCEGLPTAMIFPFEIDAEKMDLEELRVTDIGTLWTSPSDYIHSLAKGSVWIREDWDSEVQEVSIEEAFERYYHSINEACMKLYEWFTRSPRRHMVENGAFVYYAGMFMPFMRKVGLYDEYCERYNFWEFDQRVANVYYDLYRNQFARVVLPTRLFSGELGAWAPIPPRTGLWRHKYAYVTAPSG